MQPETETEFDCLTHQIQQFIQDLQQSPHDDAACHMALKGFCGAIAGLPALLEEMEANTADLFAHSVTTVTPDVRWLVQEMGKRDRLLGEIAEFMRQSVPFSEHGRMEELLGAIASLYTPPPSTHQRPPNTHLSPYELGQE